MQEASRGCMNSATVIQFQAYPTTAGIPWPSKVAPNLQTTNKQERNPETVRTTDILPTLGKKNVGGKEKEKEI